MKSNEETVLYIFKPEGSNTETHISIGDDEEFATELQQLEKQAARIDNEIAKINDQVNTIREHEKEGTATLEEKAFLDAAIRIRAQKNTEKAPITERIKYLGSIIDIARKATLRARTMIYGGAVISVGGFTQILNSDRARAVVRSNGSSIVIT